MLALFDLDGTVADINHRLKIAGVKPPDKEGFQAWLDTLQDPKHIKNDIPITEMRLVANALSDHADIVYITGRHEALRRVTFQWLKNHFFPSGPLYMRKEGDWRKPGEFKAEIVKELVELYGKGGIAIDDDHDGDTSEVYRTNGFLHLKVLR